MSAEEAYSSHVSDGWKSAGTWSFTVGEAGLPVLDDGEFDSNPVHHASVDFRSSSRRERERASKLIKLAAVLRGATYLPRDDVENPVVID